MPLIMLLRVVFGCGLRVGVGQVMMTVGDIRFVGFLFVIARFVKILGIFVVLSRFPKVISGFFVMFVCHALILVLWLTVA